MNFKILLIALALFIILPKLFPVVEHAAGSPGTLVQLATSSTETIPYGYNPWWRPYNLDYEEPYDSLEDIKFMNYIPWVLIGIVLCKYVL